MKKNHKMQLGIINLNKNKKLMKNGYFFEWKFFMISKLLNQNQLYKSQNLLGKINDKKLNFKN